MEYRTVSLRLPRLFRRKENPAWRTILFFMSKLPIWTPKNYRALSEAGFQNCNTVFACVSLLAQSVAGIEFNVYKRSKGKEEKPELLSNHALKQLIDRPNEKVTGFKLKENAVAYYLLSGNSYIIRVGLKNSPPKYLYNLRPDRINIIPGDETDLIGGYQYTISGEKQTFDRADMLHIKSFHPTNDFYGLSPLEVAAKNIDISNLALTWNMKLIQNDMRPPGAFSTDQSLRDTQFTRLEQEITEKYAGAENAGKPLLLEGGVSWQSFSISPKDADWLNSDKVNDRKICRIYHVAPELIGDSENKTYSNYQEARKALYMETVLPLADMLCDEFNLFLSPLYGKDIFLGYDKSKVEAIQKDEKLISDIATSLVGSGLLTGNEARERFYKLGPLPGLNEIRLPISLVPISESEPEGEDEKARDLMAQLIKTKARKSSKGFWQDPKRKEILWKSFFYRVEVKERQIIEPVESFLKSQAKSLRNRLSGLNLLASLNLSTVFNIKEESEAFKKRFKPWYFEQFSRAVEAGLTISKGELYELDYKPRDLFHLTPEQESLLYEMIINSGTEINEFTMKIIQDLLILAEADSWTVEEFTQEIYSKLNRFSVWRSRLIARTESAKVENWGQFEGYKESQFIERRGWLSAFVKDTRPEHADADATYSDNPIPLDEPFIVMGESLMYPGDPAGSPKNICNCLCSTFPDVREE